ncbi:MAG: hypothetical protein H6736_16230 [Alphaproteobacteria bacterium]|nr:hypothetical protein [Alphaproteobacteria bacterium]
MSDDAPEAPEVQRGWPPFVRQWVLPFVEDAGLVPVLVALLGHAMVIIGPLLLALGRGNPGASIPLTPLILLSYWLCRTEHEDSGRLGGVTLSVVLTWVASLGFAWLAARTGIL